MSTYEKIGAITVDAGIIMIGDPSYHLDASRPYAMGRDWRDFCKRLGNADHVELEHDNESDGLAVVVGGFGGDGYYPVEIRRDEHGLVSEVRVRFIEEG